MHTSFRGFAVSTTKTSADHIPEINCVSSFRPDSLPRHNGVLVRVLDAREAICLLICCYFRMPPWGPDPLMKMTSGKKTVVFRFPTAKEHASLRTLLLISHFRTRMSPDIKLFRRKETTALHYCPASAFLSLESKEKTKYIHFKQYFLKRIAFTISLRFLFYLLFFTLRDDF